jgi:probable HAF family extracellular repeat protein
MWRNDLSIYSRMAFWVTALAMTIIAGFAMSSRASAQQQQLAPLIPHQPQRYTIIDLGTLGGTFSWGAGINNKGWVAGFSTLPGDLSQPAFLWRNGKLTNLGTLGGPNSQPSYSPFSETGDIGGGAETPISDPNGEDFCYHGTFLICRPVLWHDGVITALPTLGGYNGVANQVNNKGQVAGVAESASLPPACLPGLAEPVVWEKGHIQELHVFPGDFTGVALAINDKGEAAGFSATCTTFHALLWRNGTITDLGNLGGIANNVAAAINDQGQIAGVSDLPGDTTSHAFLWQHGKMADLGTLPGDFSSNALGINSKTQVVGVSNDINGNPRAILWECGVMTDLNALLPAGSPWFLIEADSINSRGEIVGGAFNTTTGETHGILAIPCDGLNLDPGCHDKDTATGLGQTSERPNSPVPGNVRGMLRQRPGFGSLQPK